MGVIHKLQKDIIPKIAAGEVIENPAGAVKELIENSIDAKARKIIIELGGDYLDKIRVTDDGVGISSDDLEICFLPFYTSKLASLEDLSSIHTLGFRGEALSSLCAVSAVTIKSRDTNSEYGTKVDIREGTILSTSSVGMNLGTIVEVVGLFNNIPVRRKFLKNSNVEFEKILEIFFGYALSYPEISFILYRNGKLMHHLRNDTFENRTIAVLGRNAYKYLIPLSYTGTHFSISGYISNPQGALNSGLNQYLFVNNRFVHLKDVSKTIKKSYGTLLPHDVYPQFIFFLSLNPDLLDVNVHPKKQEIRFWDNDYVLKSISDAVKETLQKADLTYVIGDSLDYHYDKSASKDTFLTLKESVPLWKANKQNFELYETTFQIDNTYIATPVMGGLLLVDQHAAHESVLYNELYTSFIEKKVISTAKLLETPVRITFGLKEATLLAANLESFSAFGFDIYQISSTDFNVASVPEILLKRDIKTLVSEMLSDILQNGTPDDVDNHTRKTLAFLACRSAIKAGDYLAPHEQKNILQKLDECSDIYTCPHGRPVKIIITNKELAKFFKRIK